MKNVIIADDGEVYVCCDESKEETVRMSTSLRRVKGMLVDEDGFTRREL